MVRSSKLCHFLDQVVQMAFYTVDDNGGDPCPILHICGVAIRVEALHARLGDPSAATLCLCKPVICCSDHEMSLLRNQSTDYEKENAVVNESHLFNLCACLQVHWFFSWLYNNKAQGLCWPIHAWFVSYVLRGEFEELPGL